MSRRRAHTALRRSSSRAAVATPELAAAARGALLPRLGRELPRALRRRDRARRPRDRDRARHRRGPAARAADARARATRSRCRGGCARRIEMCEAAVEISRLSGNPHYLVLVAVRARLGPLLRRRPRRRDRGRRGEPRVGGRLLGGTMPAAAAARAGRWRCRASRLGDLDRRARADGASSADVELSTGSRSSAASTGRTSRMPSSRWAA